MKKLKFLFVLIFGLTVSLAQAQQNEVSLFSGKVSIRKASPGANVAKEDIAYNVTEPTLTVYPADGAVNTGTAVIIAPGGGFFQLSVISEGSAVAEWFSKRGVTAFVLKYRLVHTVNPTKEFVAALSLPSKLDSILRPVAPLAMADGLAAVSYVRRNAALYHINPEQIGFLGFSAGGSVAMSVAYNGTDESRPNFIALIYPFGKGVLGSAIPKQKIPAFILLASNDPIGSVPTSLEIYNKWLAAKQPVELHIFQNGGHGFGMSKQKKLTDSWADRLGDWLRANNLI